ncbi:ABC transporter permease [Bacteroidota bacterium]
MLKNYFLTTYRNIVKNKFYFGLIILGLAIGLITAIFILVYVKDELSFDKHHKLAERIYRLDSHFMIDGKDDKFAVTAIPLAPTLKDEFPEIIECVRFSNNGTQYYKYNEIEHQCDSIYYTDSTIFDVFNHKFVYGSPENSLNRPYTIVFVESLAKRIFGNVNPVGKTVETVEGNIFEVTAVIEDVPANSHLKFKALISAMTFAEILGLERLNDRSAGSFWNINVYSYVLLEEKSKMQDVIDKFPPIYDKYMKELGDQIGASFKLEATAMEDLHLRSGELQAELPTGNMYYVYIMIVIAIFVIIIASINYMNMSTARSYTRAREVGIRKVIGASKALLIRQFLGESIILTIFALVISFIALPFLLPIFNEISSKSFEIIDFLSSDILIGILFMTCFVGIISGLYPAFYLSGFKTTAVLKGKPEVNNGTGSFRKVLVVFQFMMSVFAIISTFMVNNQLNYMRNKDLGYDQENVIMIEMRDTTFKRSSYAFQEELLKNPDIVKCALSISAPSYGLNKNVIRAEGSDGQLVDKAINNYYISYDYIDLMQMELVKGRNYSREMGSDWNTSFIVNEAATKFFGWGDSAIGKRFQFEINLDGTARRDGHIIGVVKDFHYASLHNKIDPLVMVLNSDPFYDFLISVKTTGNNTEEVIQYIEKTRDEFNPLYPFKYDFLSDRIDDFYSQEKTISKLSKFATVLILIIAALGLLGLSSYMALQKNKEIGIRKVHGASISSILWLFIKEFSKWVIIANVIAWPVAYYYMDKWLMDFEYHTKINLWIFGLSLLLSMVIAIATVMWQSLKASMMNPSITLKYE